MIGGVYALLCASMRVRFIWLGCGDGGWGMVDGGWWMGDVREGNEGD